MIMDICTTISVLGWKFQRRIFLDFEAMELMTPDGNGDVIGYVIDYIILKGYHGTYFLRMNYDVKKHVAYLYYIYHLTNLLIWFYYGSVMIHVAYHLLIIY